jgi:protein ImuB
VDRRACVDVPALALQLLVRAHPDWAAFACAVVDADEPNGRLLWVNERAWRARLRPGMRYASALALDRRLRAGVVAAGEIETAVGAIIETLRRHTPHVEPSREEAGVFWLDANGLESLYTSTEAWAGIVARDIRAAGYDARLAVGFTRFGTYALAKTLPRRVLVCRSEDEERRRMRDVALDRLGIDPDLARKLARLGVRTAGDFLDLPGDGIRRRFGNDAWRLHRRARGETWDPLVPLAPEDPLRRSLLLEDPVTDSGLVLFLVRRLLALLLGPTAARGKAVRSLAISLHRSLKRDRPSLVFTVRAAEPTLDEAVLVDLVRLRLESELLFASPARSSPGSMRELAGASIIEIEVEAEAADAREDQLRLFHERTRRDLSAGARALARVRAELGEGSVVRAVLRQGHLPEASFAWEPIETIPAPSPRIVLEKPLVRRIEDRPLALPPRPFRERDDSWIPLIGNPSGPAKATYGQGKDRGLLLADGDSRDAWKKDHRGTDAGSFARDGRDAASALRRETASKRSGAAHGRVENMAGPYILSGGWWNREMHREYHYASTEHGEILWVYYDRQRRRWFLAGKIE